MGTRRVAIIAGSGQLPQLVAASLSEPVFVSFAPLDLPAGATPISARIEHLEQLFEDLKSLNVTEVCFAGAMSRPRIDPSELDKYAMKLVQAFGKGDDAVLRVVISLFEAQGFSVTGAADLLPDLVLSPDTHWGRAMTEQDHADAVRARSVLDTLSPLDVGQGAACAGGQMLGIETVQGTNAMLEFVAQTSPELRACPGVFVKAPKLDQDLRMDMPTIGPDTVDHVIKAGLGGIVIPAGQVIVLDRDAVRAGIEEAGLFLTAV